MYVHQIHHLSKLMGIQILALVDLIDDKELDLTTYWKYIQKNLKYIGLFGAFNEEGKLLGFLHAEAPSDLFPKKGYLYVAATYPEIGREGAQRCFGVMTEWLESRGATYVWGWTKRSPRACERLYGMKLVKERQMVCPIVGDDYLNVELE